MNQYQQGKSRGIFLSIMPSWGLFFRQIPTHSGCHPKERNDKNKFLNLLAANSFLFFNALHLYLNKSSSGSGDSFLLCFFDTMLFLCVLLVFTLDLIYGCYFCEV